MLDKQLYNIYISFKDRCTESETNTCVNGIEFQGIRESDPSKEQPKLIWIFVEDTTTTNTGKTEEA